jgi:hypothetical protein
MKEYELNIGLLVEATGEEISRGVAAEALAATGFESHASILHNGEWEGQPQPTLVVVGFAPSDGWHAHNLAVVLKQDSIAVLDCDTGHGRLDGRNPQGHAFDHGLFVTFEQALEAELERRKLAALEDLEHARAFEAAKAKDASDAAFIAAATPPPKKEVHKFKGFTLELERDGDTLYADISHGDFAGSLAFAEHNGYLDDGEDGKRKRVPQEVIEHFWKLEANFA